MRPKSSETSAFAFSFTFVLLQLPRRRAPRVRQLSRRPTPRELEADGEQLRVLAEEYGPVPDAGPEVLNFPLSSISAERTFAMGRAIDLPRRRSQSRSTFCREVFLRVNRALAVRESCARRKRCAVRKCGYFF